MKLRDDGSGTTSPRRRGTIEMHSSCDRETQLRGQPFHSSATLHAPNTSPSRATETKGLWLGRASKPGNDCDWLHVTKVPSSSLRRRRTGRTAVVQRAENACFQMDVLRSRRGGTVLCVSRDVSGVPWTAYSGRQYCFRIRTVHLRAEALKKAPFYITM